MNMIDELLNNTFFDKMAQQKLNDEIWAFMYHNLSIETLALYSSLWFASHKLTSVELSL